MYNKEINKAETNLFMPIKNKFTSKIIQGDILKVLDTLDIKKKFDLVIADPPYNIGKNFGNNKTKIDIEKYIKWVNEWLFICFDLLSENGLIYIYGFPEVIARIACSYPIDKQRILVWHYTNKTTPTSTFWQKSYESILCLWRNEKPKLEIDQIREEYTPSFKKLNGKKRKGTKGRFGKNQETLYKVNEKGALPRDVIKLPALAGGAGNMERWFMCKDCNNNIYPPSELPKHTSHNIIKHPTQKPIKISQRLIKSRINGNNGRVLIPFAGSGSECVSAKLLDIEFLAIELNPEYIELANKWLKYV